MACKGKDTGGWQCQHHKSALQQEEEEEDGCGHNWTISIQLVGNPEGERNTWNNEDRKKTPKENKTTEKEKGKKKKGEKGKYKENQTG